MTALTSICTGMQSGQELALAPLVGRAVQRPELAISAGCVADPRRSLPPPRFQIGLKTARLKTTRIAIAAWPSRVILLGHPAPSPVTSRCAFMFNLLSVPLAAH